jgi:FeS assembly protein SufD
MYTIELLESIAKDYKLNEKNVAYRKAALEIYETESYPVWKRLKVKDTTPPEYQSYNNQKTLFHKQSGLTIEPIHKSDHSALEARFDKPYGISLKHRKLTEVFSNTGTFIQVDENVKVVEPIVIQLELNQKNPVLLDHHLIYAKRNSEIVVVVDYKDQDVDGYQNAVVNIYAESGAKVQFIKLQNLSKRSTHIFNGLSLIERDAKITYNSIDLGATMVVTDYSTYLLDENSEAVVESVYLGDGHSKLDLGYNIYHEGRRSLSNIMIKGALLDQARKVFRGNLFFRKGAKRAQGSEQEYVILLSEGVHADSIPALMCDEDDVQGEHAASAGQVDENKLFYLMSRGLSEKEAKQLIIMASFAPVIDQIPIEGLQEKISTEISIRLDQ